MPELDWSWLLGPDAEDEEFVLRQINAGRIDLVGEPATGREFLLQKEVDRMPETEDTLNLDQALEQGGKGTETPATPGKETVQAGIETPPVVQPEVTPQASSTTETPSVETPTAETPEIETEKAISAAAKAAVQNALKVLLPHKAELAAQMNALGKLLGYPSVGEGYPKVAAVKGLEEVLKSTSLPAEDQEHLVSLVKAEKDHQRQIVITEKKKLTTALEKAQEERETLRKELVVEQTIRKHAVETKRVETELKHLPGKPDETATLLMKAQAGMGEDYDKLETLLQKADSIIKKGTFLKTLGTEVVLEGSPESELASLVKKGMEEDPGADEAVVRANILKSNTELYNRLSPPVEQT